MRLALVVVLLVGGILRLQQAVPAAFPLGDGGLFSAAVDQIREAGGLPTAIAYNGQIPFVYPPLGFLVGALFSSLPGVGTEAALRVLPPAFAIVGLALVPWCAGRVLKSQRAGLVAGGLTAVMPQAYDQLVAGGGLTRGLGVALALAAVGFAAGSPSSERRGAVVGLLLGLTVLAHPRVAMFALLTVAFVWWWNRANLSRAELLAAIGLTAVCVVPWLGLLAARGQLDALMAGGQRFDIVVGTASLLLYPGMQVMHGGIPNLGVCLAVAGVMAALFLRRWDILLWLLAVHVLSCPPFVSAVAWAIAGAAGIVGLFAPAVSTVNPRRADTTVAISIIALVAVMSASASPSDPGSKQQPLSVEQVESARGLSDLPEGVRLAVVTTASWGNDLFGEWLPALSGRTVLTTPQGSEWLGVEEFGNRVAAHQTAQECARQTSECLATAIERGDLAATHVVIPRGSVAGPRGADDCCPALVATIRNDARFDIVVDDEGVLVAVWVG